MFDYKTCDSIVIGIKNRSYRAICPDCGSISTFIADGEIVLHETSYDMSIGGRSILDIKDIDVNLQINMLCKQCRNKNDNKDNCIIENFSLYRLLSAFQRFDYAGIGNSNWCELSKKPKLIEGNVVNTYIMPAVRYVLPKSKKEIFDSILATIMIESSMTEGSYVVLGCDTYEDSTAYYSIEFFIDQTTIGLVYNPENDGDYNTFVNNLFIRKIDELARLIELATP